MTVPVQKNWSNSSLNWYTSSSSYELNWWTSSSSYELSWWTSSSSDELNWRTSSSSHELNWWTSSCKKELVRKHHKTNLRIKFRPVLFRKELVNQFIPVQFMGTGTGPPVPVNWTEMELSQSYLWPHWSMFGHTSNCILSLKITYFCYFYRNFMSKNQNSSVLMV